MMLSSTVSHEPCCRSIQVVSQRFALKFFFLLRGLCKVLMGGGVFGRVDSNEFQSDFDLPWLPWLHYVIASTFFSAKAMCLCQGRVFLISKWQEKVVANWPRMLSARSTLFPLAWCGMGLMATEQGRASENTFQLLHFMNINELFVIPVEVFKRIHFLCHGAWNWQWHFVLNCIVAKCYL